MSDIFHETGLDMRWRLLAWGDKQMEKGNKQILPKGSDLINVAYPALEKAEE